MQKFTVFSIILSLSVVLILSDMIFHDYLGEGAANTLELSPADVIYDADVTLPDELTYDSGIDSTEMALIELAEEIDITVLHPGMTEELFVEAGFFDPTLKDTIFSGYVFQFIGFSDQTDAFIYQWNLFDGQDFIGSVYEIKYPSEMGGFQGYLSLRERAELLTDLGTVNEVNIYGDSSFYFNHVSKTKTVHKVVRSGANVYAFDYAYSHHDKMQKVFEGL